MNAVSSSTSSDNWYTLDDAVPTPDNSTLKKFNNELEKNTTSPSSTRIEFEVDNDSNFASPSLSSEKDRRNNNETDDDGWTNTVGITAVTTKDNKQTIYDIEHAMFTERGGWQTDSQDMSNLSRTDTAHITVAENTRHSYGDTRMYTSIGGGIQIRGSLGGQETQREFHRFAGGRLDTLQSKETRNGSNFTPIATLGSRIETDLSHFTVGTEATTFIPLGEGIGSARLSADIKYGIDGSIYGEQLNAGIVVGVNIDHTFNNDNTLEFNQQNFTRLGVHARVDVGIGSVGTFYELEIGGVQNETTGTVGFTYTFGEKQKAPKAWLNPSSWK